MKLIFQPELEGLRGLTSAERETVQEILADLGGAADRIRRAGEKWVGLNKRTREKVLEAAPPTWGAFLNRLTLVGERKLHPHLYAAVGNAARWLGKLPLEDQDRYLRGRIPVVTASGRDTRLVDVEELSELQREQVFKKSEDGTVVIRDVPQQKAFLEERKRRLEREQERLLGDLTSIKRPGRWRIEKGRLYPAKERVEEGYTKGDVKRMLKDLAVE